MYGSNIQLNSPRRSSRATQLQLQEHKDMLHERLPVDLGFEQDVSFVFEGRVPLLATGIMHQKEPCEIEPVRKHHNQLLGASNCWGMR